MTTNGNKEAGESRAIHPNGKSVKEEDHLKRPTRDDKIFFQDIFPASNLGKVLKGLLVEFLSKQEHRIGWARKSACDDPVLAPHPNESVAAHQWGVANIIMALVREQDFKLELPNFNYTKALEMALKHDVAEVITGDITPVDGISQEDKHQKEKDAMKLILGCYPKDTQIEFHNLYHLYESRKCAESKFVKDCDKLDFIIQAFLLERQGFSGFPEFYTNAVKEGFSTKIAKNLAHVLLDTRESLLKKNLLYNKESI